MERGDQDILSSKSQRNSTFHFLSSSSHVQPSQSSSQVLFLSVPYKSKILDWCLVNVVEDIWYCDADTNNLHTLYQETQTRVYYEEYLENILENENFRDRRMIANISLDDGQKLNLYWYLRDSSRIRITILQSFWYLEDWEFKKTVNQCFCFVQQ